MTVDRLINILAAITLIEMMVTIGLGVTLSDVMRVARSWSLVARAVADHLGRKSPDPAGSDHRPRYDHRRIDQRHDLRIDAKGFGEARLGQDLARWPVFATWGTIATQMPHAIARAADVCDITPRTARALVRDWLAAGRATWMPVFGGSMEPSLREGSRILVVATHPAGPKKPRVGVERNGIVYELFLTTLPQGAFTAADVVALYLHRGAFENALSDEDIEHFDH